MKSRILIFGKGFFGKSLQRAFGWPISDKKIFSFQDVQRQIDIFKPKIIINAIGHIGRNVDDCELNMDKTLMANTFLPILLADIAVRNKIKLVHISSGCIYNFDYNKDKSIKEDKIPDYFDLFYSRSKIYAERALDALSNKYNILIVRPRVPLDRRPDPKNLLDKLIGFKGIIDIPNSVTYMPDFAEAIRHLIKIDAKGIYNVVNKGGLSYPRLLDVYKKYKPDFKYKVIDYKKLGLARTNMVLSTGKLEKTGFKVRHINDVLEECVRSYVGSVPINPSK